MEKILVLNGSHSEITLIHELKKMGKYVITTGNLPDSFVHKYADEYIREDYSDVEAIAQIAQDKEINGVVSCANDFGIITAAYVSERMNFYGHDPYSITKLLHQKDTFKKFALENDLMVPFSKSYASEDDALKDIASLSFPVIVKPSDLTGGKGVNCAWNIEEYISSIRKAFERSRKKTIVVEQYVEGTYHSLSTFLVNKKVIAYYSDNEFSNVYRYFVDTSVGPADYHEDVCGLLINQAEIIAEKLNLVNGIFHMQYVLDKNKKPFIIDIARRTSGDIYPEPIEHSTGIPWSKWTVMAELGYDSKCFTERGKQTKICGRHCIMADKEGIVKRVVISEELVPYVYKKIQWHDKGYEVTNHTVDKLGILFYEFPDRDVMKTIISRIKDLVRVEIEN